MTVDPQKVYLIVSNSGQPTPIQFLKNGTPTLISIKDPMVSHLHQGPMIGEGVQFYNENGEIECGVQVDTYHFFVDSNNKVRPIPPGSILQGNFKPSSISFENFSQTDDDIAKQKVEDCEKNALPCYASEPTDALESSVLPENTMEDEIFDNGDSSAVFSKPVNLLGDSQDLYTSQEDIELEEEIVSVSDLPMKGKVAQELTGSKKSTVDDGLSNSNVVVSESSKISHGKYKKKKKCRTPSTPELAKKKVVHNKRKPHLLGLNAFTSEAQHDSKAFSPVDSSINSKENQMDKLFQIAEAELLAVTSLEKKEKKCLNTQVESVAPSSSVTVTAVTSSTELDEKHDTPSFQNSESISDSLIMEEPATKSTSSNFEVTSSNLVASHNEDLETNDAIINLEKINLSNNNVSLVSSEADATFFSNDLESKLIQKCHEDNATDKPLFSESCELLGDANLVTKSEMKINGDETELTSEMKVDETDACDEISKNCNDEEEDDAVDEISKNPSAGHELSVEQEANNDAQSHFATETNENVQSATSDYVENNAKNDRDQSNKHQENSAELCQEELSMEPCPETDCDALIDDSELHDESVVAEGESKSLGTELTSSILSSSSEDNRLEPCNITKSPNNFVGDSDEILKTNVLSPCKEVLENDKTDKDYDVTENLSLYENEIKSEKSTEEPLNCNIIESSDRQDISCIEPEKSIDTNEKSTDVGIVACDNICPHIEINYEKEDLLGEKLEVEKLDLASNKNYSDEETQRLDISKVEEISKNKLNQETDHAEYISNFQRFVRIRCDWSDSYIAEPINKKMKIKYEHLLAKNLVIEREQEIRKKTLTNLHSKLISERRQMRMDEIRRKRNESDAQLEIKKLRTELEVIKTAHSTALDEIKALNSKLENFNCSQKLDVPATSCGNTPEFDEFSLESQIYNTQQGNKIRRKSQRINAKDELKDCDDKDDIKSVTSVETSESNDSKPSRITRRSVAVSKSDSLVENKFSTPSVSKSCDTDSVITNKFSNKC